MPRPLEACEQGRSAAGSLERATAHFLARGIRIERVLTDG